MNAADLVALARAILADGGDVSVGRWSRSVALLTRQALETTLDELWATREPGMADRSTRAQLLCRRAYIDEGDGDLAELAAWTWWALTQACHFHPYELVPTAAELDDWLDTVTELSSAGDNCGGSGTAGRHLSAPTVHDAGKPGSALTGQTPGARPIRSADR